jgi:hypothetical protein
MGQQPIHHRGGERKLTPNRQTPASRAARSYTDHWRDE